MSTLPSNPAAAAASSLSSAAPTSSSSFPPSPTKKVYPRGQNPGLRYIEPYYYPYKTYAKGRWLGRELLEVVSTEFRDRSVEYYRHALEAGVTTLNGQVATPTTIVRSGDALQNTVHRHEPPISIHPIQIIYEDPNGQFIVIDKPGGMPVHPTGRYTKNTVTETLISDFPYEKVHTVNRLDRLTSGLMFIALNPKTATDIQEEFKTGTIRKEYLARVRGEFPAEEVIVDEPLLTVDRQSGLVVVAPEGKEAKTIFNRVFYDAERDQSVVACKPITGRTHQIRVHLQYLGHPIPNDPIYGLESVWSGCVNKAKGGIDLTPEDDDAIVFTPDYSPEDQLEIDANKALVEKRLAGQRDLGRGKGGKKLMPRETGEDVGSSSPIKLSKEAREVIRRLRRMKDESEDWARWKDVVLYTQEASKSPAIVKSLTAHFVDDPTLPTNKFSNRDFSKSDNARRNSVSSSKSSKSISKDGPLEVVVSQLDNAPAVQEDEEESTKKDTATVKGEQSEPAFTPPEGFCSVCYIPLAPDPDPDRLFIYLHARRYRTNLGEFETGLPIWGREDWDGSNSWSDRATGQGLGREVLPTLGRDVEGLTLEEGAKTETVV